MRHLLLTKAMRNRVLALYDKMDDMWTHEAVKGFMGLEVGVSRMSAYLNLYGMRYDWKQGGWRRSVDRGQLRLLRHYGRKGVSGGLRKGAE